MNSYAPFLQFIATIYFSMCFEEMLGKYFWGQKWGNKASDLFVQFSDALKAEDKDVDKLRSKLNNRKEVYLTKVNKKALILLFVVILVLLFCGCEDKFIQYSPCWKGVLKIVFTIGSVVLALPIAFLFWGGRKESGSYLAKLSKQIENGAKIYSNAVASTFFSGNTGAKDLIKSHPRIAQLYATMQYEAGDSADKQTLLNSAVSAYQEEVREEMVREIIKDNV